MYKYEDFQGYLNSGDCHRDMIDQMKYMRREFKRTPHVRVEKLQGLGDSWKSLAIIDRLEELGYIKCVLEHRNKQFMMYQDIGL